MVLQKKRGGLLALDGLYGKEKEVVLMGKVGTETGRLGRKGETREEKNNLNRLFFKKQLIWVVFTETS